MKKNKTIASIIVIIGCLAIITGIILDRFILKDEKNGEKENHEPVKLEFCESINYEEKSLLIVTKYLNQTDEKDSKYVLLKSIEDFYRETDSFEYIEEEINFDFIENDYIIYFLHDDKNCNRSKYLTDYSLNENNLSIEFTKTELNITECQNDVMYGYVIAVEKNKVDINTLKIDIVNKEDPFKECYK